ncbi:sensor histidine kinase [Odoribacter lunatus]|uniref:sensor histidine kinase n=1 Tax=Odoribacter lunatus TaxID=2941335 RepID=UPI00203AFB3E|nr:HAMP domain-containing sensor histidine kinase [Odoribacter lunatus]
MIKKVILRLLLVIMLLAFSTVVVVQWLWIKHAFEEQRDRFSSKVYDVLNRVVNRIEEVNYVRYVNRMNYQIQSNSQVTYITSQRQGTSRQGGITYLSVQNMFPGQKRVEEEMTQELVIQTMNSSYEVLKGRMQELTIRLIQEKETGNIPVEQRLRQVDLENLLSVYFRENKIEIPFSYKILTKEDVLNKVKERDVRNFYYVALFPNDYIPKNYYLGVSFDSVQKIISGNMGWLLLASGFCVFGLLFVFIITIVVIMRQQKLSVIKNDFINNMTHEFKTPIATISLATAAMAKEKVLEDKESLLRFNDIIRSENDRMNVYVERILQQAKLDCGELPLNKTEIDINKLIEAAAETFLLQVQNAGGILTVEFNAQDFKWEADEVHMMNVICNLLDNAVKYSVEVPVIEVYTKKEGKHFVIGVRDHGIGISKELQKKVFQRFYRVSSGNLHNVKGFGLGLNYVKNIVELHGGNVRLTSRKNKGTLIELIF